jgi:hypothetical protein
LEHTELRNSASTELNPIAFLSAVNSANFSASVWRSYKNSPADFSEQLTEVNINEGGQAEVTGFPILGLPW